MSNSDFYSSKLFKNTSKLDKLINQSQKFHPTMLKPLPKIKPAYNKVIPTNKIQLAHASLCKNISLKPMSYTKLAESIFKLPQTYPENINSVLVANKLNSIKQSFIGLSKLSYIKANGLKQLFDGISYSGQHITISADALESVSDMLQLSNEDFPANISLENKSSISLSLMDFFSSVVLPIFLALITMAHTQYLDNKNSLEQQKHQLKMEQYEERQIQIDEEKLKTDKQILDCLQQLIDSQEFSEDLGENEDPAPHAPEDVPSSDNKLDSVP